MFRIFTIVCLLSLLYVFRSSLFQKSTQFQIDSEPSKPVLRIFTYSSFSALTGPGPELVKHFEKICSCEVKLVNAGDAGVLLTRVSLEPGPVDLLVGLDQLTLPLALKKFQWEPATFLDDPPWVDEVKDFSSTAAFVPYDWSPMGFIYREGEIESPKSWEDLKKLDRALSLQDPRSSSPGLQFLYWMFSRTNRPESEDQLRSRLFSQLKDFKKIVHSYSPSWSSAYGLFQSNQSKMTFSYVTSVLYHQLVEKDFRYRWAIWDEGVPYQVEFMAIPKNKCRRCDLAKDFINFSLSPKGQKIIMTKNFMLPVIEGVVEGTAFESLPKMKLISYDGLPTFLNKRALWIEEWRKASL